MKQSRRKSNNTCSCINKVTVLITPGNFWESKVMLLITLYNRLKLEVSWETGYLPCNKRGYKNPAKSKMLVTGRYLFKTQESKWGFRIEWLKVDCGMGPMVIWKPIRVAGSNTLYNKNVSSIFKEIKKRASLTSNSL